MTGLRDLFLAIAGFWADLALFAHNLGEDLETSPAPLDLVASFCFNLSIYWNQIAQNYLDAAAVLHDIDIDLSLSGIIAAFQSIIAGWIDSLGYAVQSLIDLIREFVYKLTGVDLTGLFGGDNVWEWDFSSWFGMLSWFFMDPGHFLVWCVDTWGYDLGGWSSLIERLLDDPVLWVREMLEEQLDLDISFLEDPLGYILDYLLSIGEDVFDTIKDQVITLGEHVLRKIIEGVW